jgi:hypothetical protein
VSVCIKKDSDDKPLLVFVIEHHIIMKEKIYVLTVVEMVVYVCRS